MGKNVFKIAAGGRQRDYRELFLESDLALIGPGGPGKWLPENEANYSPSDQRALRAFAGASEDDLVLLTVGHDVVTLGRFVDEYDFSTDLGLVAGWDLFHFRRVKWADPDDSVVKQLFDQYQYVPVKVRRRCCRLGWRSQGAIEWANQVDEALEASGYWSGRELADFGKSDRLVEREDVRSWIPSSIQQEVLEVIQEAKGLWEATLKRKWAYIPSESEAVALIVVPMLLALGWEPKHLTLEWKRTDVACFEGIQRNPEDCRLIVEAKRPGQGLKWAKGQAFEYARKHEVKPRVITTNGFYWALFEHPDAAEPVGTTYLPQIHESDKGFFQNLSNLMPQRN